MTTINHGHKGQFVCSLSGNEGHQLDYLVDNFDGNSLIQHSEKNFSKICSCIQTLGTILVLLL